MMCRGVWEGSEIKFVHTPPPAFFLHHRPQNLGKKKAEMQKKGRNAKKRQKCKKKKQKMHVRFQN